MPGRARPVPAIPSGTWRAAGRLFRVPVRQPRSLPVEAFTRVRRAQIAGNGIAGSVISAGGTATVSVGPQGYGTRWYPNQVAIATASGVNDASSAAGFLNVIGPGGFLFQSYAGGGDQPGIAVPEMQAGDLLYVTWSGGHPGDWCQVQVIGPMDVLTPGMLYSYYGEEHLHPGRRRAAVGTARRHRGEGADQRIGADRAPDREVRQRA